MPRKENGQLTLNELELIKLLYVDPHLSAGSGCQVDIYPMGMLLLEIFTNKLPFLAENGLEDSPPNGRKWIKFYE